jgi:competence protein ComEC
MASPTAPTRAASAWRPYHPLLLIVAALATGIVADRYWPVAASVWWLASMAGVATWCLLWRTNRERAGSAALLAAWVALGGAWHHDRWHLYRADEVGRMVHEEIRPIAIEGIALHSPRWVPAPPRLALRAIPQGDESEIALRVTAVRDGTTWRPASGWAVLVCEGHLVGVRADDRVRIMALGSRPRSPLNPGEFDFAAYERSRRTWCRLQGQFPESVSVVARGSDWSPRLLLSGVRGSGNALLRHSISSGRSTLAAAILLGSREQLDPDRNEDYLVTGTIHVLSISGLHVGILAWGFWVLLRTGLVPPRPALAAAMLLTLAYAALTDFQPPVVRASVLVVTICVARLWGREAFGFNALALAGLIVLAFQPASLFLAGPQLSFLAVAAMIVFRPLLWRQPILDPLDRLIAQSRPAVVRGTRWLGDFCWRLWLTGAIIWAVSLPLVWQQYNLISPSALVINVLIWVPISLALYGGFAALLLGGLIPPLGAIGAWICDGNLWFMEQTIAWGRALPGSYGWWPAPPWWWIAAFYVAIGLAAALPPLRLRRIWLGALPAAWFALALVLASPWTKSMNTPLGTERDSGGSERPLACSFVAVGHGIAAVVELPDGQTILYDCGKLGAPLGAARSTSSVLWSRGITHLDAIIISHADSDHFSGVPELLDRYSVGAIYVSPVMFDQPQPAVAELRAAIERSGVPLKLIAAGDRLRSATGTRLEVLHPPRKGVIGSDNANSILLLIEHAGRRLLLTGDLESPGLADVLAEEPLDCDAILAPHHGSRRSDPTGTVPSKTHNHPCPCLPPQTWGMNTDEFHRIRLAAREKRDRAIVAAKIDYEATLAKIAELELIIREKPAKSTRKITAAIEQAMPKDRPFTIPDILDGLELLDPARVWRRDSVTCHMTNLRKRGLITRIKRAKTGTPAVYVLRGVKPPADPFRDMTLLDAIRTVLKRPMTAMEIAIALKEAGYTDYVRLSHLRKAVGESLAEAGARFVRPKWFPG